MNTFILHITFNDSNELHFAGSHDDLLQKLFQHHDKIFNVELSAPAGVFDKHEVRLCAGVGTVIQSLLSLSDVYKIKIQKTTLRLKELLNGNHEFANDPAFFCKDQEVQIVRDYNGSVHICSKMYTSISAIYRWPTMDYILPKTTYSGDEDIDYMKEYVKQEIKTMLALANSGENAEVLKRLNIMDYIINSNNNHF